MKSPRLTFFYGLRSRNDAFTIVELLVVIIVVGVLGAIAIPALARTRNNGHVAQCMNNLRRLTAIWSMYAADNRDLLVTNAQPVAGNVSWGSSDTTNTAIMLNRSLSPFGAYVQAPELYKCPADRYQSPNGPGPRVRSVSMSNNLGGTNAKDISNQTPGRTYFLAKKTSDLSTPGPAMIYVMLDEHPDKINDSTFFAAVGFSTANARFQDLPASFHSESGSFSFADGHFELKRWRDSRTVREVTYTTIGLISVPGSEDYVWLNDRQPYHE